MRRPSLLGSLRAAHLRLSLSAVLAAGLILSLVAFLTLRTTVDQNLTLVARSISYSAEAATVFGDATAAQEVLTPIAAREGLQAARIVDRHGRQLTQGRALLRYVFCSMWFAVPLAAYSSGRFNLPELGVIAAGWVAVWAVLSRFHPERQFWHDAWAGTRLVDDRP